MKQESDENFYFDDKGFVVFTAKYLSQRGECCGNGCRHCPYSYVNVAEPKRSELLTLQKTVSENKN